MINKILLVIATLVASFVSFALGDLISRNGCNKAIDLAVNMAQTDFDLQLEKANLASQKLIITTTKKNEAIKATVFSYDIIERTRLLSQVKDFEARK